MRYLTVLAMLIGSVVGASGTVSIDQSSIYSSQRSCAYNCWENSQGVGGPFNDVISCAQLPITNDCFCRPDLQYSAVKDVENCIGLWCMNNALDISVATKLYKDYCTSNGYIAAEATTASSTTGAFTVTVTKAVVTVTVSSETRGSPAHEITRGYTISLTVVATVLLAILGGIVGIFGHR